MPSLKVKTIYIEKLKALGVYDAWRSNVKEWYDKYPENLAACTSNIYNAVSFERFIVESFWWGNTPEGHSYWCDITKR